MCTRPSGPWFRDHDALIAEPPAGFQDELGIFDGARVDGNLITARREEFADILNFVDAAADREWDKDRGGHFFGHFDHRATLFMRGRDIEEHQLIGFLLVISFGAGHGIARVFQGYEFDAFDDPAAVNIKTWDDASSEHGSKGHLVVLDLLENMDDGSAKRDQLGHDREKNGQKDQEYHSYLWPI